jgi:hypothetical protein
MNQIETFIILAIVVIALIQTFKLDKLLHVLCSILLICDGLVVIATETEYTFIVIAFIIIINYLSLLDARGGRAE